MVMDKNDRDSQSTQQQETLVENNVNPVRGEDRRRFFRIDDEVNLTYRKVEEQEVSDPSYVSDDFLSNSVLAAGMDALNQEAQLILRRLEKANSDVADYLKLMDDKIDLIARSVLLQENDFSVDNTREVNISATGLAFVCQEALNADDFLEIKMLLPSNMAIVVTYGKVVYRKKNHSDNSEYPYVVGLDYVNMKEQDRELLIKHVVKRQMQQIRGDKQPNEVVR
jgi:c-di-GMP-binding flagellar brake protein YcgR